jgi:hypothetical protein
MANCGLMMCQTMLWGWWLAISLRLPVNSILVQVQKKKKKGQKRFLHAA